MNIIKRMRTEEGNAGEIVGRKDTSKPFQDAIDSYHLPLVPVAENLKSENIDELDPASKKHEVVFASLRILQKRRDDLVEAVLVFLCSFLFLLMNSLADRFKNIEIWVMNLLSTR